MIVYSLIYCHMINFLELLAAEKDAVKKHWLNSIIETYPADSREFFASQKDRFQNPVGSALSRLVDSVLEALLNSSKEEVYSEILEEFIRMRAVQEFSPSKAIGFILYLKESVRTVLVKDNDINFRDTELIEFEKRVDNILLTAFNLYTKSRDKLYEIRVAEIKRKSFTAFRMIGSNSE